MAQSASTIDEIERARSNAEMKGKAFVVPEDVFRHYADRLSVNPTPKEEVEELSEYLGERIEASERIGLTRSCTCPHCGHEFTFADHFRAAVEAGVHTRDQLIEFTTSSKDGRYYLVIDTDAKIPVSCTNCGRSFEAIRCCYTTNSYAYV